MRLNAVKRSALALAAAVIAGNAFFLTHADAASVIDPVEAAYGYYVDAAETNTNTSDNAYLLKGADEEGTLDPSVDASTGVLSKFLKLWTPGEVITDEDGNVTYNGWATGTAVDEETIQANIQKAHEIAWAAADDEAAVTAAYNDEANNQSYSVVSGLGEYAQAFLESLEISEGNWDPSETSDLYAVADLVDLARQRTAASTNGAKLYYRFPRPYRWTLTDGLWTVVSTENTLEEQAAAITDIVPASIIAYKSLISYDEDGNVTKVKDGSSDGGFPSGHTNAATISALALAYAVPQQFDELVMRAADLGNNRIVAGMHSPLDVMGGRITGTAVAAAAIYNDADGVAAAAYEAAQEYLIGDFTVETADADAYEEYQENLALYIYYLTYDFAQTGDTTAEMTVPKGAEVLLRTRLPYMTDEEIRYVLYSTGLESGYPLLDDDEGWGRLNYYAAANGYGSFVTDTTVTMNAEDGGYSAKDNWLNDIDGEGSLTKEGTGELVLAGTNSYSGGTTVNGGVLTLTNSSALGTGAVSNNSTLSEEVDGAVVIGSDYVQSSTGTLALSLESPDDVVTIEGTATLDGALTVAVNYLLSEEKVLLICADEITGEFSEINVTGADEYTLVYEENGVCLQLTSTLGEDETTETTETETTETETTEAETTEAETTEAETTTAATTETEATTTAEEAENESTASDTNSPSTGDSAPVIALMIMIVVALSGMVVVLVTGKKAFE